MKTVHNSSQVFHLWAHQTQEHARNSSGSVYFNRAVIFSYRDSWPLAMIHERKGEKLVLTNCASYSVTTSQHQNKANRAVSHLTRIAVPKVKPDVFMDSAWTRMHAVNLEYLKTEINAKLAKAKRAMTEYTVNYLTYEAREQCEQHNQYLQFFGIRRKPLEFPTSEFQAAVERARAIEKPDPIRDAKRFQARQKRQEAQRRALQNQYDELRAKIETYNAGNPDEVWRQTGRMPDRPWIPYKLSQKFRQAGFNPLPQITGDRYDYSNTLLRVHGDKIQTSRGAEIPLDHAPRLWRVIQRAINGTPYQHNGHSEYAGEFRVDSIDTDGTLKAGCHTIKYPELERLAKQLNLA
jgi:hypothetical protein